MRENMDQKNSKYGHFLYIVTLFGIYFFLAVLASGTGRKIFIECIIKTIGFVVYISSQSKNTHGNSNNLLFLNTGQAETSVVEFHKWNLVEIVEENLEQLFLNRMYTFNESLHKQGSKNIQKSTWVFS